MNEKIETTISGDVGWLLWNGWLYEMHGKTVVRYFKDATIEQFTNFVVIDKQAIKDARDDRNEFVAWQERQEVEGEPTLDILSDDGNGNDDPPLAFDLIKELMEEAPLGEGQFHSTERLACPRKRRGNLIDVDNSDELERHLSKQYAVATA